MIAGGRIILVALAVGMTTHAATVEAKRLPPKEVAPVVAGGVRYTASHFGASHDKPQNGGYVQAWDVKTGKLLWDRMVYRVRYDANREQDVQDDFITELRLDAGHLLVKTERAEVFDMDLRSGRVRALTKLGPHIEISLTGSAAGAARPGVATGH